MGGDGNRPALAISPLSACLLLLLLLLCYCTRVSAPLVCCSHVVSVCGFDAFTARRLHVNLHGAQITQVHNAGMRSQPKCRH